MILIELILAISVPMALESLTKILSKKFLKWKESTSIQNVEKT